MRGVKSLMAFELITQIAWLTKKSRPNFKMKLPALCGESEGREGWYCSGRMIFVDCEKRFQPAYSHETCLDDTPQDPLHLQGLLTVTSRTCESVGPFNFREIFNGTNSCRKCTSDLSIVLLMFYRVEGVTESWFESGPYHGKIVWGFD